MTYDKEKIEAMKNVDVRTVDPDTLVDINDVHIDPDQSKDDRFKSFLEQIKNPYCYKVGKVIVKVEFQQEGPSLEDKLAQYIHYASM